MKTVPMSETIRDVGTAHHHVFLGEGHEGSERRTWAVIGLCGARL
jgi:hypothetical protein